MKKRNSLVITGISTIFLIFAVLSVCILALLSLGNSRTSRSLSKKALLHTQNYYHASSLSADWCSQIQTQLEEIYSSEISKEQYYDEISENWKTYFPDSDYSPETHLLSNSFPVSDSQDLMVSLEILFPENAGDSWIQFTSYVITP